MATQGTPPNRRSVFEVSERRKLIYLAAAVLAQWLCLYLGPFWLAMLPVGMTAAVYLIAHRDSMLVIPLILLSPPATYFGNGLLDWHTGTAISHGAPRTGRGPPGIDAYTRTPQTPSDCLSDGEELATSVPYDLAVMAATRLLGPMQGAYTGPIPTEDEVWRLDLDPRREPNPADPTVQRLGPELIAALRSVCHPVSKRTPDSCFRDVAAHQGPVYAVEPISREDDSFALRELRSGAVVVVYRRPFCPGLDGNP